MSITSLKNPNPDCGTGVVLPHALAAGVEMARTASGEGMGPASGQRSKGVYLLGVALECWGEWENPRLSPRVLTGRAI